MKERDKEIRKLKRDEQFMTLTLVLWLALIGALLALDLLGWGWW